MDANNETIATIMPCGPQLSTRCSLLSPAGPRDAIRALRVAQIDADIMVAKTAAAASNFRLNLMAPSVPSFCLPLPATHLLDGGKLP